MGNLDLQFFADGMTDAFDELGIDRGPDFRRDQESTGFQALLELRRDDGADLGQGVASGQRQAIVAALYYPTRPQNYGFDLVGGEHQGRQGIPGPQQEAHACLSFDGSSLGLERRDVPIDGPEADLEFLGQRAPLTAYLRRRRLCRRSKSRSVRDMRGLVWPKDSQFQYH